MDEQFYLHLIELMGGYANRMNCGPPLTEFEVLAYEAACRTIEAVCNVQRRKWEQDADDAQAELDEKEDAQ
jgi:hypothetical protein